jgi:hypothetical protein
MTLAALRWTLLASTLAACSQSEPPPVPAFETVTIDLRETSSQLVPLPARKPLGLATAPAGAREPSVVAAALVSPAKQDIVSPAPIGPNGRISASPQAVASSEYGSVTRYFKRWLPDFNKITDCPSGITCQAAFAN